MKRYEVLQVVLREKFTSLKTKNLSELEYVINGEAAKGWTLHTFDVTRSAESGNSLATMVFECDVWPNADPRMMQR